MKFIIGLGNPSRRYQNTRHNVGFLTVEYLFDNWLKAEGFSDWSENSKFEGLISKGTLHDEKIILLKPQTYMNNSGQSVQSILNFYKANPTDIIVLHDDIDLPFGKFKVQAGKSSAGHNGVGSIIERIGSKDFLRFRIGIGKEKKELQGETVDFVLNRFNLKEKLQLKKIMQGVMEEMQQIFF